MRNRRLLVIGKIPLGNKTVSDVAERKFCFDVRKPSTLCYSYFSFASSSAEKDGRNCTLLVSAILNKSSIVMTCEDLSDACTVPLNRVAANNPMSNLWLFIKIVNKMGNSIYNIKDR